MVPKLLIRSKLRDRDRSLLSPRLRSKARGSTDIDSKSFRPSPRLAPTDAPSPRLKSTEGCKPNDIERPLEFKPSPSPSPGSMPKLAPADICAPIEAPAESESEFGIATAGGRILAATPKD